MQSQMDIRQEAERVACEAACFFTFIQTSLGDLASVNSLLEISQNVDSGPKLFRLPCAELSVFRARDINVSGIAPLSYHCLLRALSSA